MPIYRVKRTLIVHANVEVMVEADSPDEADRAAFYALPCNIGTQYPDAGWKATVEVKPPKGTQVFATRLRSMWIDHTDAGNNVRPRRITEAAE